MVSYRDEDGNIRSELLSEEAEETAKSFIKKFINRKTGKEEINKKHSLTANQIRRFYGDFKSIETKLKNKKDFKAILPLIAMQKSKAEYAANPNNPKIPPSFKNFISENVDTILKSKSEEDFKAFMLYFEAVVGFFYGQGVSKK